MLLLQQLFIAAVKIRLHFLLPMILPGKYFAQGSRIKTGMSHQLAYAIRKLTQDIAYQLRIQMTACQHTEEMLRMVQAKAVGALRRQLSTKAEPAASDHSADTCMKASGKGIGLLRYTYPYNIILITEL